LRVLLPDIAFEIVPTLEEVIGSTAVHWALVESSCIMDIVNVASKVLGIFEG
jgi:hypothetical protein